MLEGMMSDEQQARPNVVLITADDLNWHSVGAYGCTTPDCTPNIDALAAQGMRFEHAHVTVAVCQPSRGAMMTGCYPHHSGQEGFYHIDSFDFPLLTEELQKAGFLNGILGKIGHSSPRISFPWDYRLDMPELGWGRDADVYGSCVREFVSMSRRENKPFFLMANAHDPHRPFHGNDASLQGKEGFVYPAPSRTYRPDEIDVPGFLPDVPEVRQEIAEYSSSVRRCDDVVGKIVKELQDAGVFQNTLVMFLSDNGMAFPFAKSNCYLHSTKTPLIVSWPNQIRAGEVDTEHFVSGIDLMPTILDAIGLDIPADCDGSSFLPVLHGNRMNGRGIVFTQYHETYAQNRYPMRCVQNHRFGYIFNPWSDGTYEYRCESQSGRTFKAMQDAAKSNGDIAGRVDLYVHRVPEELYDFANDPDATCNLIGDPEYVAELERLQSLLEKHMEQVGDPALEVFRHRYSDDARQRFMREQAKRSDRLRTEGA
jgi:N-sulfoglucosamine sulfohydrolase